MGGGGAGRVTATDVACWLLKTSAPPTALEPGWTPAAPVRLRRCLRRSYRLHLMAPGDRCLLWLSGREAPGVHALGVLLAQPGPELSVEVELHLLDPPVERAELLDDPGFSGAEVVRMPAGSNPSHLARAGMDAVSERVDPAALLRAGWT